MRPLDKLIIAEKIMTIEPQSVELTGSAATAVSTILKNNLHDN